MRLIGLVLFLNVFSISLFAASDSSGLNEVEIREEALLRVASEGNLAAIRKMNLNEMNEFILGEALNLSIEQNRFKTMQYLLSAHKYGSHNLGNALLMAAKKGELRVVKELHAKGGDLNFKHPDGTTPMSVAAKAKRQEIVTFLKNKGVKAIPEQAFPNREVPMYTPQSEFGGPISLVGCFCVIAGIVALNVWSRFKAPAPIAAPAAGHGILVLVVPVPVPHAVPAAAPAGLAAAAA